MSIESPLDFLAMLAFIQGLREVDDMPLTEFEIIEKIKTRLTSRHPRVLKGLGDDTAVIAEGQHPLLFCSDLMIESVHFDLSFMTASELGHKAIAACFSDLVAMNGTGLGATVSLAVPQTVAADFIDQFYAGLNTFAASARIECVGGDLARSPHLIYVDVSCLGESARPIYRSGARVGDLVVVSGTPGASAAGLYDLQLRGTTSPALRQKHLRPSPRFDLQPSLQDFTSLIDISDGLISEAHHIAKASGVGLRIDTTAIPLHEEAVLLVDRPSALDWALHGGEDYELLGTLPAQCVVPAGFTVIGRVTEGLEVTLVDSERNEAAVSPRGYDHFRR